MEMFNVMVNALKNIDKSLEKMYKNRGWKKCSQCGGENSIYEDSLCDMCCGLGWVKIAPTTSIKQAMENSTRTKRELKKEIEEWKEALK